MSDVPHTFFTEGGIELELQSLLQEATQTNHSMPSNKTKSLGISNLSNKLSVSLKPKVAPSVFSDNDDDDLAALNVASQKAAVRASKNLEIDSLIGSLEENIPDHISKSCTIFVGNLPLDTNELSLRDQFSPFGEIIRISVIKSKRESRPTKSAVAFIEFDSNASAADAVSKLNGASLFDRTIRIELTETRPHCGYKRSLEEHEATAAIPSSEGPVVHALPHIPAFMIPPVPIIPSVPLTNLPLPPSLGIPFPPSLPFPPPPPPMPLVWQKSSQDEKQIPLHSIAASVINKDHDTALFPNLISTSLVPLPLFPFVKPQHSAKKRRGGSGICGSADTGNEQMRLSRWDIPPVALTHALSLCIEKTFAVHPLEGEGKCDSNNPSSDGSSLDSGRFQLFPTTTDRLLHLHATLSQKQKEVIASERNLIIVNIPPIRSHRCALDLVAAHLFRCGSGLLRRLLLRLHQLFPQSHSGSQLPPRGYGRSPSPAEVVLNALENKLSDPGIYLSWRLFSLCNGDSFTLWRTAPFRMVQNGPLWIPPSWNDMAILDELYDPLLRQVNCQQTTDTYQSNDSSDVDDVWEDNPEPIDDELDWILAQTRKSRVVQRSNLLPTFTQILSSLDGSLKSTSRFTCFVLDHIDRSSSFNEEMSKLLRIIDESLELSEHAKSSTLPTSSESVNGISTAETNRAASLDFSSYSKELKKKRPAQVIGLLHGLTDLGLSCAQSTLLPPSSMQTITSMLLHTLPYLVRICVRMCGRTGRASSLVLSSRVSRALWELRKSNCIGPIAACVLKYAIVNRADLSLIEKISDHDESTIGGFIPKAFVLLSRAESVDIARVCLQSGLPIPHDADDSLKLTFLGILEEIGEVCRDSEYFGYKEVSLMENIHSLLASIVDWPSSIALRKENEAIRHENMLQKASNIQQHSSWVEI